MSIRIPNCPLVDLDVSGHNRPVLPPHPPLLFYLPISPESRVSESDCCFGAFQTWTLKPWERSSFKDHTTESMGSDHLSPAAWATRLPLKRTRPAKNGRELAYRGGETQARLLCPAPDNNKRCDGGGSSGEWALDLLGSLAPAQRGTEARACTKLLFIGGSCKAWHFWPERLCARLGSWMWFLQPGKWVGHFSVEQVPRSPSRCVKFKETLDERWRIWKNQVSRHNTHEA